MSRFFRIAGRTARWTGRAGWRLSVYALFAVALVLAGVVGVRVHDAVTGPPLAPWHTLVPDEMSASEIEAASFAEWLAAEDRVLGEVGAMIVDEVGTDLKPMAGRYEPGGPIGPGDGPNWNRTQVLVPGGLPRGAAVLLHGLTDAPYSLRHVAEHYRDRGFVAVVMRMPGHGTVPGGLIGVTFADWAAATRLAVREATARAGAGVPLHVVGYSNGAALAVKYALEAMDDAALPRPARLVLMSPMIGVTEFARFAGIAGWPAVIPSFVRAAWFSTLPEFNPFKYNSFPVNAAVQAQRLTAALRTELTRHQSAGQLAGFPPLLTFQSAVDSTVSPRAVIATLYDRLPANGSELVLYDLNRAADLGPLIRPAAATGADGLLPPAPRAYSVTVIGNAGPGTTDAVERVTRGGSADTTVIPLASSYPRDLFSLGHVALPFRETDGLYGPRPDPADRFGIHLGTVSSRGELGVLVMGLDTFSRVSWNPFYDAMIARIDAAIDVRP